MRVGLYTTAACFRPEYSDVAQAHVQIALKTAQILTDQGHDVVLFTTRSPHADGQIPDIAPQGLRVRFVENTARPWPERGNHARKIPLHIYQLTRQMEAGRFDLIHFFGEQNCAWRLAAVKACGVSAPAVMTFTNLPAPRRGRQRMFAAFARRHVLATGALTEFTRRRAVRLGFRNVELTRPGVVKSPDPPTPAAAGQKAEKRTVLFWRSASVRNGADVCLDAFVRLSKVFPQIDFVFAIRGYGPLKDWRKGALIESILTAERQQENIRFLPYPYPDGATIHSLLDAAICVVLPFRELSVHPQLCILETLLWGVPLVTTDVESNLELVDNGRTGLLVKPSDAEGTYSAIRYLLEHRAEAAEMGKRAACELRKKWNWDAYERGLIRLYESAIMKKRRKETQPEKGRQQCLRH